MLYLKKKMCRDLWNMKTQFIAVFLMAFFAVFIYVGLEGVWYGMSNYSGAWFEESNVADAWVKGYQLTSQDIQTVSDIEGIRTVQAESSRTVEMKDDNTNAQLLLMASQENIISQPKVISGVEYDPEGAGIWLYADFALAHNIMVGDNVTVEYNEKNNTYQVQGLVLSPEFLSYSGSSASIMPNHSQYGYGYISPSSMEMLSDSELLYDQLKIIFSEQDDIDRIRLTVEEKLESKYIGYSDRSDFKGISNFTDKFIQLRSMTILFAVLLTLLAMLTMQTTMKRMIEIQRIQIGTLKAIGFQNRKIRIHFLFYGFWVSLLGGVAGLLIAPISISSLLLSLQKELYSLPEWKVNNSWISIFLLVLVVLICSVTALLASRKGTKGMPAITMRDEPPKTKKIILLERVSGFWNLLSYEWRWTLREISRNKTRTIIGIIGIIGSVTLLIDSFGLYSSLQYANQNVYGHQFDYGTRITLKENASDDDKAELYELVHENAQWMQEGIIDIRTSDGRENSSIQIYENGYFNHFEDEDGKIVSLPVDGVAISRLLANRLNIVENETIQFRLAGQKKYTNVLVKEIITPAAPQGIFMSASFWSEIAEPFSPNVLLTYGDQTGEDITNLSYIRETITLDEQLSQVNEAINSVLMIVILLIVGALLLCVTILYNLGVLSFTERSREYATLKVVGYRDGEIKSFIRHDNLLQLFIGLVLGIPAGFAFLNVHIHMASTSTFEYSAHLTPLSLVLAMAIVMLTTLIVNAAISRKALKLNMVEALKSVE